MEVKLAEFSNRLKLLRKEKNAKQADIAAALGCTYQHYQKIEYGQVNVSATNLMMLSDCFGVSVDYLLGLSDDRGGAERGDAPLLTVILPYNEYSESLKA